MAPVIDALIVGIVLSLAGWAIRRRRPEHRIKRLRAMCRRHLASAMRPRWHFVQIVREAVRLLGAADVARAAGVPITLVFDWQEGAFGNPPEEMYLRAFAVEAVLRETTCAVWWTERKRLGPVPAPMQNSIPFVHGRKRLVNLDGTPVVADLTDLRRTK
jgi:hypothetical protein